MIVKHVWKHTLHFKSVYGSLGIENLFLFLTHGTLRPDALFIEELLPNLLLSDVLVEVFEPHHTRVQLPLRHGVESNHGTA